ncbi:RNA-binding protein RO60-like [Liolophura sinensis]|uniref:RNA-binding protein RO60-like n=1 Tax=Liolophura sinensis TaxID=3198878 RepID=UPI0031599135
MEDLTRVMYSMVDASVSDKSTISQGQPISVDQVMNNAGGYGWTVTPMGRVRRFLCLGSEGGTYYVKEKTLTQENAACIERLIADGKGKEVVNEIRTFSVEGRTAKQSPILFALALCARSKDLPTQKTAYEVLNDVCRIPTHLFEFIEYCELLSCGTGWGRAHRRAVCKWYNQFQSNPMKLAMHVTKYRNRKDWTHLDVLRLAHIKPADAQIGAVTRYVVKGLTASKEFYVTDDCEESIKKVFEFISAVEAAKSSTEEKDVVELISKHDLVREHVPTKLLNSVAVWECLLNKMPMTALIRNLGKMTAINLITPGSPAESLVVQKLSNEVSLKHARIHPFSVMVGLKTYSKGSGEKGRLKWTPSEKVVKALDAAFYKAFKYVEPTDKRYCLAVDVSGSMSCPVMGTPSISAADAATAMMMCTVKTERLCDVVAFSDNLTPVHVNPNHTLRQVLTMTQKIPMGATDCALPMTWAQEKKGKYDVFIVYTDCETWCGTIHPAEALRRYRQSSGIWDAKLIVCGMASTAFTIADPNDPGMLDIVGFDSAAPEVMKNFINGLIC